MAQQPMQSDWRGPIRERFPAAQWDEPMSRHTTFRIGGPADCYLEVADRASLADLLRLARSGGAPLTFLGWGSNLLVLDKGLRGVAVRLKGDFEVAEFLPGARVRAGAGLRVPQLVSLCAERGLAGAEPLIGVPGTVGGAVVMNAGTKDGEIGDLVLEAEILDPADAAPRRLPASELRFGYRSSNVGRAVVLSALLQLKAGDKVDILERVQRYQQRRLQTQPVHTFNVGSIFKNPPGRFVAKLIEDCGLKGSAVGGARVSPRHANFIENFAGATASDVLALVARVREVVRARFGVELDLEVKIIGEA